MTSTAIAAAVPRVPVQLQGDVVSLAPHGASPIHLDVTLADESGSIVLRFQGRTELAGVHPGSSLRVTGTPTFVSGRRLVLNPVYEFSEPTTPEAAPAERTRSAPAPMAEEARPASRRATTRPSGSAA